MPKTDMIRARVEPKLKNEVEDILTTLGLNATEAITLYYKQIRLRRGIPFEISIPNNVTRKAIEDARSGKGKRFGSVGKLFKDLKR
jgi:addiction module antitoxin, RelB/DinJ family